MADYTKKAAQQAKAISYYKKAVKGLGNARGTGSIGKKLAKASAKYNGSEGPKKSLKGPVRGGPATGRGKPANKRKK